MKIIRNLFIAGLLLTVSAAGMQSASAHENSNLNEPEASFAQVAAGEDFGNFLQWTLSKITFGLYERQSESEQGEREINQNRGIKAPPCGQQCF